MKKAGPRAGFSQATGNSYFLVSVVVVVVEVDGVLVMVPDGVLMVVLAGAVVVVVLDVEVVPVAGAAAGASAGFGASTFTSTFEAGAGGVTSVFVQPTANAAATAMRR